MWFVRDFQADARTSPLRDAPEDAKRAAAQGVAGVEDLAGLGAYGERGSLCGGSA